MSRKKLDLLRARYGLGTSNLLGKGMEAEAYAYGEAQVLKVYTNNPPLEQLRTLQAFYANLDASGLGYQLPLIFRVWEEEGWVLCLVRRLPGVALSARLADLSEGALEALLQRYVTAIVKLRQVRFRQPPERYKLFDPDGLSLPSGGDFNGFLSRYLDARLAL